MTPLAPSVPATFTLVVPEARLVDLRVRLDRLAKKAVRYGQPAPTYVVGEARIANLFIVEDGVDVPVTTLVVDVTVTTGVSVIGLSGWTLLAAVDLDPAGGPAIVRTAPGVDGDPAWHTLPDYCDHCARANAGRRTLVVLAHEDGRQTVVGRTCVRDYIGYDVEATLWPVTLLESLTEAEREYAGLGGERAWPMPFFLTVADAVIREYGWMPKGRAQAEGRTSTASLVEMYLTARTADGQAKILPDGLPERPEVDVAAAIVWAQAQAEADSDYLRNLAVLAGREYVTAKNIGLAASLLGAYARAEERRLERAAEREAATPVLEGRIVITGTVLSIRHLDTDFGVVTKMTVRDDRGFTVRGTLPKALDFEYGWDGSVTQAGAEKGARVTFTATVEASRDNPTFGFYKRPTKAALLDAEEVAG